MTDRGEHGFGTNEDIYQYLDGENIITYSNAVDMVLSPLCRNKCSYCGFSKRKSELIVPYSTIKEFKNARRIGAREANIVAGERPDKYHSIRAKFDIWGFDSYVEYIYTIAELAFLEGLLVNLNVGFLSLNELKYLQDIVTTVEMCIDASNTQGVHQALHQFSPSKHPDIRFDFIRNCGNLNFPVVTGLLIGAGESPEDRIRILTKIKDLHEEFSHIQMVKINPFVPEAQTQLSNHPAASQDIIIETVRLAREILPLDVDISVPVNIFPDVITLVENGVSDLGQIRLYGKDSLFPDKEFLPMEEYYRILSEKGYELHKRLPIKNTFIMAQKYSKKLGQFLDKYKTKLKENLREDRFILTF